jgi:hypothetical protein
VISGQPGDDDVDLVKQYQRLVLERPDRALDRKILRAASRARISNTLAPIACAMAASLALMWIATRHGPSPAVSTHRAARSEVVPGLYEGRIAGQLADPAMTRQSMFEQMPGGTEGGMNHGS